MTLNTRQILGVLLAALPFLFVALRSGKINLKKTERSHQFILPIFSVVYSAYMMTQLTKLTNTLVRLIGALIAPLSRIPGIGQFLSGLFRALYALMNIGFGLQLLVNTAVMAIYCILKRILLPVIRKWWSKWRWLYNHTSAYFYIERKESAALRQEYSDLRKYFKIAYYMAVFLGYLDCVLTLILSSSEAFRFPFYPVFGIIVLGEIYCFLDGRTPDETAAGPGTEDPNIPDVECEAVMEELVKKFPDRVSLKGTRPKMSAPRRKHDWAEELSAGDDLDEVAGTYFATLAEGGEKINPDYVEVTRQILHDKNVLIYNPFYRDLTSYLLLPIFHELLNNRSCLIVCGRITDEKDIIDWITGGIRDVTNLPKLWNIASLESTGAEADDIDIGVLGFRKLYDLAAIAANGKFFERVSFVIMLEPSNILGTGQMGLRNVVQSCERETKKVTYCAIDRNADGLVDALSHTIRQSVTEVVASPSSESPYCRMFWKAEGPGVQTRILPRISHYMGLGGEVAALAMNLGVQNIHWYSGSKMPLLDLGWNIEQYYEPICQYIHSPRAQEEIKARFHFHENLWQAEAMPDTFLMVEDEFCNVFEMARTFSSRIVRRGFLNVLAESYMLRDYMCANSVLFTNDSKAIPSIVPDYARTERNFVLLMLMLMSTQPISESFLIKELALHGYEGQQSPVDLFQDLIRKHTGEYIPVQTIHNDAVLGGSTYSRFSYRVDRSAVESVLNSALKTAHYVVENEETEMYPMGNRLMDHIEQTLLPGQFFSYDSKYYQVRSISPANGIIVRRAADHINGRVYYRQLRTYQVNIRHRLDDARDLRGFSIGNAFADIDVATDGYLEMKASNLLTDATVVRLEKVRKRSVVYKEIMEVRLPDSTPEIRFTICVLLNELLKTLYPNEAGYIVAAAPDLPEDVKKHEDYLERLRVLMPALSVEGGQPDCIYFIEDSNIDLGLLVSIDRNFQRIMEILTDYLDWYLDPDRAEGAKAVDEDNIPEGEGGAPSEDRTAVEENTPGRESQEAMQNRSFAELDVMGNTGTPVAAETVESILRTQTAKGDVDGEDEESTEIGAVRIEKAVEYLTYGYCEEGAPDWLALEETLEYLQGRRFDDSSLHRARTKPAGFDEGSDYDPRTPGVHYCDFCAKPLEPDHFTVLKDGRERCPECGATAVKTRKAFKRVYSQTLDEMERAFNIKIDVPIRIRMANARKVNEEEGGKSTFTPTPAFDGRVLGYAQKKGSEYLLMVENGAPEWNMKQTLVHELTHIWQFTHWNDSQVEHLTKGDWDLHGLLYEGMAVWSEVQYLVAMGEKEKAIRYKRNRDCDPSVYGVGMALYLGKYPVQEVSSIPAEESPFGHFPPV